jgi:hypothetical protein
MVDLLTVLGNSNMAVAISTGVSPMLSAFFNLPCVGLVSESMCFGRSDATRPTVIEQRLEMAIILPLVFCRSRFQIDIAHHPSSVVDFEEP